MDIDRPWTCASSNRAGSPTPAPSSRPVGVRAPACPLCQDRSRLPWEELPVSERREEVAALIARHQVVILCGETGSGKSTQLPKICLHLGRGLAGRIGHTQPRRIAARTQASRVAQELGGETGGLVGYKVRCHDRVRPETCIKLMTDSILLPGGSTHPCRAD